MTAKKIQPTNPTVAPSEAQERRRHEQHQQDRGGRQ